MHTNEGEQSPPGSNSFSSNTSSNASDFSIFQTIRIQPRNGSANNFHYNSQPHHISHSGDASMHHTSPMSCAAWTSTPKDFSDTVSINSTMMGAAPGIPKRSNSIISVNSTFVNSSADSCCKPILSPASTSNSTNTNNWRHPPFVIPKQYEPLNEDAQPMLSNSFNSLNSEPSPPPIPSPTISPRTDSCLMNRSPFQNMSHHRVNTRCSTYSLR